MRDGGGGDGGVGDGGALQGAVAEVGDGRGGRRCWLQGRAAARGVAGAAATRGRRRGEQPRGASPAMVAVVAGEGPRRSSVAGEWPQQGVAGAERRGRRRGAAVCLNRGRVPTLKPPELPFSTGCSLQPVLKTL